jgi:hypothetical protein
MVTAKYWEGVIVFLLSEEYLKLEKQKNPGWNFHIWKEKM